MQGLKKTTIQPAKFGGVAPKTHAEVENKHSTIQEGLEGKVEKRDNRRKERPRTETKSFKIDKELDIMLLDLMEEYGVDSDSEMMFQLISTHPLIAATRNKDFFEIEENKVYLENLINHKTLFAKLMQFMKRQKLERKRAARG